MHMIGICFSDGLEVFSNISSIKFKNFPPESLLFPPNSQPQQVYVKCSPDQFMLGNRFRFDPGSI